MACTGCQQLRAGAVRALASGRLSEAARIAATGLRHIVTGTTPPAKAAPPVVRHPYVRPRLKPRA